MTAGTAEKAAGWSWRLSAEALALWERFPPRPVPAGWPATRQSRHEVAARLLAPPFPVPSRAAQQERKLGLLKVLDWLELHPGSSWQERWDAAVGGPGGRRDWRRALMSGLPGDGPGQREERIFRALGPGMAQLIGADVIRPSLGWLVTTLSPAKITPEMARVRDPEGFARLRAVRAAGAGEETASRAVGKIAVIMAAKGGLVTDITVGDCLELVKASREAFPGPAVNGRHGPYFYQMLHAIGVFPAAAPPTVRMLSSLFGGQLTVDQMVDRYDLACRPVRDLLADYLRERQPAMDHQSLTSLATRLALYFWKDLENCHPGISSLRLPPDIAAAWKQRVRVRTVRTAGERGEVTGSIAERQAADGVLNTVRAFYLDLAQWALDDPARWGPWAVPCPVRASDIRFGKMASRRKARMDQRTRERLPVLPALAAATARARQQTAARLDAAARTEPGELFTAGGVTLRRTRLSVKRSPRVWAEDPQSGKRRDLTREEDHAFWAWAAVEALRMTGIRVEELTELSHHSLVQYRLPSSGELIPLLQIAPSKTDEERLLVITPELADVLSAVVCRIRNPDGSVPMVAAYDLERTWNPPMPLLFQHRVVLENRPITAAGVRELISGALAAVRLTGTDGKPLHITPHDFRRIFATDVIMNGMPPHIAQLILGHRDINTTMGYKAVYPQEAINGHRAFIARRRALRPGEEYRTPDDAEWEEFLGHFERRKLALGDCGRAHGTSCIHEHSCIRCPLLRIDPDQRHRLREIHDSLTARIAEAEREGWTGEAEGLKVSLTAAEDKLAQADGLLARRAAAADLGIPAYRDIAAQISSAPGEHS